MEKFLKTCTDIHEYFGIFGIDEITSVSSFHDTFQNSQEKKNHQSLGFYIIHMSTYFKYV